MRDRATLFILISFSILIVPIHSYAESENVTIKNHSHEFSSRGIDDPRLKKHKLHLLLHLVITALLIKSIVFPLVLKAMAVMTSVSVLLSFKSLIISSIVGYINFARSVTAPKVVYVNQNPRVKKGWNPSPDEYIVPPIFGSKFSYVPRDESVVLDDETKVIDHYHTFVD